MNFRLSIKFIKEKEREKKANAYQPKNKRNQHFFHSDNKKTEKKTKFTKFSGERFTFFER